jgi:Flp pilus assembly pilin Flp
MFLRTATRLQLVTDALIDRLLDDDRGQATAEYGLVILAAGGIALGVIAWAGKTGTFTGLFESVVKKLTKGV